MALQMFVPKVFNPEHRRLIDTMTGIMDNYSRQGYDLSLRQLYYQLVAHHNLPNKEQSYKRIGDILGEARLAGLVDWDNIVDRGRTTIKNNHWNSPAEILDACASQFSHDLRADQPWHVEVMVEKQALEGVLQPVCRRLDVPFTSNKGYSSLSALKTIGDRLREKMEEGHDVCLIYLGDHDPSGIDMTRDVEDRLKMFSGFTEYDEGDKEFYQTGNFDGAKEDGGDVEFVVQRVALNMDQVRRYNPPENPAKLSDSRAEGYIRNYGYSSWELDALDPTTLGNLVRGMVSEYTDDDRWSAAIERRDEARAKLVGFAEQVREDERKAQAAADAAADAEMD